MFTEALFTRIWMHPKCPLTDEEIMDTHTHTHAHTHTHTVEYYSAIKKNKMLPLAATRMDLEGIMTS